MSDGSAKFHRSGAIFRLLAGGARMTPWHADVAALLATLATLGLHFLMSGLLYGEFVAVMFTMPIMLAGFQQFSSSITRPAPALLVDQKTGTIKFSPGMTIVEAIALSGGLTPMARANAIKVTRKVETKNQTYVIPYEMINEGKRPNFPMLPGDQVYIDTRVF